MKKLFFFLTVLSCILATMAGYIIVGLRSPTGSSQPATTSFNQPFSLTDHNGNPVTEKTYLGKPTLYFFGFTHCPDVCPTTLTTLTGWLEKLGPEASRLNVVFVSVDPARDTPASLKDYISNFHPSISAAVGTPEQTEQMAKVFMIYYAKVPQPTKSNPDDYTISHSTMVLMADKDGIFKGTLDSHEPEEKALGKLRALLAQ